MVARLSPAEVHKLEAARDALRRGDLAEAVKYGPVRTDAGGCGSTLVS